jgi:exodeoxyribonuclease VII large subunit
MAAPTTDILTPTSLAQKIKTALESAFGRVAVAGEMSGVFRAGSGHTYFSLKDKANTLQAVAWRSYGKGPRAFEHLLADGLEVLAYGTLTTYGPRSVYQLVCDRLEPRGEGALRRAYELLKRRLEAEGVFLEERKRALKFFPGRVALLTSRQGAAVEDFVRTAVGRFPGADISLFPVRVQGDGAADEMAEAIAAVGRHGGFDLIVLTRGGGSAEDLWAFNEEQLVRAVADSRVPVLAAIGHSTDVSLCELAADVRAITPTAAAEKVFPDARACAKDALLLGTRLRRAVDERLGILRGGLEALSRSRDSSLARLLATWRSSLDRLAEALAAAVRRTAGGAAMETEKLRARLATAMTLASRSARSSLEGLRDRLRILSPARGLAASRAELEARAASLSDARKRLLRPYRTELERASERLRLLSPLGILTRGYSIATDSRGRIVKRASDLDPGDPFRLLLGEGALAAKVTSREPS